MTRTIVYSAALVAFAGVTAMTFAANLLPTWITWSVDTKDGHFSKQIGLHRSCSSTHSTCQSFPQEDDCHGTDRYFCSMWRSVSFLMSFAAVFELVTLVAYVVVIVGGKQKRENGWRVLSLMCGFVGLVLLASISIVAYLFDNDDRFFVGWRLDNSFTISAVSCGVALLCAVSIALSKALLPEEGGYELIPSERYGR